MSTCKCGGRHKLVGFKSPVGITKACLLGAPFPSPSVLTVGKLVRISFQGHWSILVPCGQVVGLS